MTEMEPDVHEVPRLFRTVLLDTVEGTDTDENLRLQAARFDKQRSKSLSFVSFRSKFRTIPFRGGALGGSRGNLQEEASWYEEDEVDEEEEVNAARGAKRGRSRSMSDIRSEEHTSELQSR